MDQLTGGLASAKHRAGLAQAAADWVLSAHRSAHPGQQVPQPEPQSRRGAQAAAHLPMLARLLPSAGQQMPQLLTAEQPQQPLGLPASGPQLPVGLAASGLYHAATALPPQGAGLADAAFLLAMRRATLSGWSAAQHALQQAASAGFHRSEAAAGLQRGASLAQPSKWPQQHVVAQQSARSASMPSPVAAAQPAQPLQPAATQQAAGQPLSDQPPLAAAAVLSRLQEASWQTAPDAEQAERAVRAAWVSMWEGGVVASRLVLDVGKVWLVGVGASHLCAAGAGHLTSACGLACRTITAACPVHHPRR